MANQTHEDTKNPDEQGKMTYDIPEIPVNYLQPSSSSDQNSVDANQMHENTKHPEEQGKLTYDIPEIPVNYLQPSSFTGQNSVDANMHKKEEEKEEIYDIIPVNYLQLSSTSGQKSLDASQPEYVTIFQPAESSCEAENIEYRRRTRGFVLGVLLTGVCVLGIIVIVLSVLLTKKNDDIQSVLPKITVAARHTGTRNTAHPLKITVTPRHITVEKGRSVTFACRATGQPEPFITWSKSYCSLPLERMRITGGNLTIVNVNTADSGNYFCWATNNKATTKSSSVILMVISRLEFNVRPPVTYKALVKETLLFNCSGKSDLKFNITRMRENIASLPSTARVLGNGSLVIEKYETKHAGLYTCKIANRLSVLASNMRVETRDPKSCSELRRVRSEPSGTYVIDPDGAGGVAPFTVYCNMMEKNGVGVTVIRHNSQRRILVNCYESRGSYSRNIRYTGASLVQLASLTRVSTHCEQFIKYDCYHSYLLLNGNSFGWWMSRDRQKMMYWGGADPVRGNYKCACGMTNSCADRRYGCNCDKNDLVWRTDSGLLTDKSTLPVSQLRFGDTGVSYEKGYHTLGELKCYGE